MCLFTGHIGGTSTRAEARPAAQATAVGHDRSCWNRRESLVRALSGAPDPRDARVSDTGYRWSWPRRSRRSGEFTEQASEVAGQQPEPAPRVRCLDGESGLHLDEGDFVAAQVSAAEALRLALDNHDPVTVLQARTTLAMAALRLGDIEPARVEIDRASWYRRDNRSLIVLALQALIAFRQDPDGEARKLFEKLESEAVRRRQHDPEDFGAWDLEAIAICGSGVDRKGRAARARYAFGKARPSHPTSRSSRNVSDSCSA